MLYGRCKGGSLWGQYFSWSLSAPSRKLTCKGFFWLKGLWHSRALGPHKGLIEKIFSTTIITLEFAFSVRLYACPNQTQTHKIGCKNITYFGRKRYHWLHPLEVIKNGCSLTRWGLCKGIPPCIMAWYLRHKCPDWHSLMSWPSWVQL